jgi:hypothetical protein
MNDGMRRYSFLRGDEAYKSRFASCDPGIETFIITGSALGTAAAAGARALRVLPPTLKRPFRKPFA